MIETNAAWKRIAIDPYHHTTFDLTVDGRKIPPDRIALSPEITSALYTDRWSVGNVASSCLTVTYLPDPMVTRPEKGGEGTDGGAPSGRGTATGCWRMSPDSPL